MEKKRILIIEDENAIAEILEFVRRDLHFEFAGQHGICRGKANVLIRALFEGADEFHEIVAVVGIVAGKLYHRTP